jgi:hypothetical protein
MALEYRSFLSQCADCPGAGAPEVFVGVRGLLCRRALEDVSRRWEFVNSSSVVGCWFSSSVAEVARHLVCLVALLRSSSGRRISISERCCDGFGRGDLVWSSVVRC